jgi:hypothetical protein
MFRVTNSFKRLLTGRSGKWLLASVAAGALGIPAVAQAGRYDPPSRGEHREPDRRFPDRHDDHHDDRGGGLNVDIHVGDRHPAYETREVRVWVPPVYRTVEDRRWVEPVYRTETDRVWVPDQFEDRQVRYMDRGRWCTRVDHVLVVPAHYETRDRPVCLTDGHWENFERQELVAEGHYEVHQERVRADASPVGVINPMLAGLGVHVGR